MKPNNLIGILLAGLSLIPSACAVTYTNVFTSIMGKSSFGLLIDLHLQDFVPIDQAIMYYNYIGIFFVVLWATFASQSNESRYTFTTPFMAALMVWVGWLHANDTAQYWGMIIALILLGALIYINDMNHEKYGLPGPGDKVITMAVMILCFSAGYGYFLSNYGIWNESGMQAGASQNSMCNVAYTCDSSGQIALEASVTQISSTGGLNLDIVSVGSILLTMMISAFKTFIIMIGSVVLFSGVILAAYPALLDSPQAIAFLVVMQLVVWAVYAMAFFRYTYKPTGSGGGEI